MNKTNLILLKFLFSILDFLHSIFGNKMLLRHKFKIGILIFAFKTYSAEAQIDLVKGTCYRLGPRPAKAFDFILQDRPALNDLSDNTIKLNLGFQRRWISGGISSSYHFESSAFEAGPYIRLFPIERRYMFKQFIAFNYQFELTDNLYNEFNVSTGLIFRHTRPFNFEIGLEYTHANSQSVKYNYFRPVVGIHYNIWMRRKQKEVCDE